MPRLRRRPVTPSARGADSVVDPDKDTATPTLRHLRTE